MNYYATSFADGHFTEYFPEACLSALLGSMVCGLHSSIKMYAPDKYVIGAARSGPVKTTVARAGSEKNHWTTALGQSHSAQGICSCPRVVMYHEEGEDKSLLRDVDHVSAGQVGFQERSWRALRLGSTANLPAPTACRWGPTDKFSSVATQKCASNRGVAWEYPVAV